MLSPMWAVLLGSLALDQSTAQLVGKLKVVGANPETCNLSVDSSSGSTATLSHSAKLELQQQVLDWKTKAEQFYGRNRKYKYWITSGGGYSTGVSNIATSQNTRSCINLCHKRGECEVPGNKCLHKISSGNCQCILFSSVAYPGGRTSPAILGNGGFEDGSNGDVAYANIPSWNLDIEHVIEPYAPNFDSERSKILFLDSTNYGSWGSKASHSGSKYAVLKADGNKWIQAIGQTLKGPFVDGFYKLNFRARIRQGYDNMLMRIRVDSHVVGTQQVTTDSTWQHFSAFLPMKSKKESSNLWIEVQRSDTTGYVDGALFIDTVRLAPADEAERSRKTTPVFWDKQINTNCKDAAALTHMISGAKPANFESCETQTEITEGSIRSAQVKCEADDKCEAIMVLRSQKYICFFGAVGSKINTVADTNADCFIAKRETRVDNSHESHGGNQCSPDAFALCEGKSPCLEITDRGTRNWLIRNEDPFNYGVFTRINRVATLASVTYRCATAGGCANMVGSYVSSSSDGDYINVGESLVDTVLQKMPGASVAICNGNKNQWFATKGVEDSGFMNGASIMEAGKPSGPYRIHVPGALPKTLYVDNDHAGGGWVLVAKYGSCDKSNLYNDGYVGDQSLLEKGGLPADVKTNSRLSMDHINKIFKQSKYHTMRFELDTGTACVATPAIDNHYCQKIGSTHDFDAFMAIYDARKWSEGGTNEHMITGRGTKYRGMIESQFVPILGNITNEMTTKEGGFWDTQDHKFAGSGTVRTTSRHMGSCMNDVTSGCQWMLSNNDGGVCEDNRFSVYIR